MHAHANQFRTVLLLALVAGLVMATGAVFGQVGFGLSIVGAAGLCAYLYLVGPSLPLRSMHARRVTELEAPVLFRVVRELSTASRQPMPAVYVSPTAAPNSFAAGNGPGRAAVCCTAGLLNLLTERELRAVVAHELAHIAARDTLISSVAGALGAVICGFAGFGYILGFGDGGSRRSRLVDTMLSVLAPIAGGLIRLGVSRTAEIRADHDGALLAGDPQALASALQKASDGVAAAPLAAEPEIGVHAHSMLISPFRDGERFAKAFDNHPPLAGRLDRLTRLTN